MIVKTAVDTYQENRHAKWPTVTATITQQAVRHFMNGRDEAWRIESEVRYTVEGVEMTANFHSGIGNLLEERAMRTWAAQHPPGTSLLVRYDPQHHDRIIPDAGAMPGSEPQVPDDLKGTILFFILTTACIIIGRVPQRGKVEPV
jgi:hypothetical protein